MSKETKECFSISVKIVEASDLPHPNISSLACVKVGKEMKCTKTIKNTDSPRFNEYFIFDLFVDFTTLLRTVITVMMYEQRAFRMRKLIGLLSMEASTVWALEGRRMSRWLIMSVPSDTAAAPKGFVSCDIMIEAGEKHFQVPDLTPIDMPDIIGGLTGRIMVRIYRCVGLDVGEFGRGQDKDVLDVTVRVSFANNSETTTKRKLSESVEWNEQITFIELLPPLFQKITVEVIVGKKKLASRDFYLSKISHVSKDGFLPTYGPTFVHFYDGDVWYKGSLFMEIETEQISLFKYQERLHVVMRQPIQPKFQPQVIKTESFLCYGVVFDVVLRHQKSGQRDIHLALDFGKQTSEPNEDNHTRTRTFKTTQSDSDFQYLSINEEKPCIFMKSEWPDTRNRLYNSNVVSNLYNSLKSRIDHAQNLLMRGNDKRAEVILGAALQKFKSDCKKVPKELIVGVTKYDKERIKLITKRLNHLASIVIRENSAESLIERSTVLLSALESMYEDPQDSLPYIFVSVMVGQESISYCKVHPRDIIYSQSDIRIGLSSGKISTRLFNDTDASNFGQMSVWLWLGLWSQVKNCLVSIPPGHDDITKVLTLPTSLAYTTNEKYAAVCNVYRGNISLEGSTGACDPFVRVLFAYKSKQTNIIKRTLAPLWKEALVIEDVQLYPDPSYLENNPPVITVELLDGSKGPEKVIGSAFVEPKVRYQPLTKEVEYNLDWIKLGDSQILGAFEVVRLSSEPEVASDITPQFLDPPMISHRLEVVFWGIRGNNVRGIPGITQPEVIIQVDRLEIKSENLEHGKTFFSFKHDPHVVDVELPKTKFYSPPLILRLNDSAKDFGSSSISNIHQFSISFPTKKQWKTLSVPRKSAVERAEARKSSVVMPELTPLMEQEQKEQSSFIVGRQNIFLTKLKPLSSYLKNIFAKLKPLFSKFEKTVPIFIELEREEDDDEEYDWWYRYFLPEIAIYKSKLEDVKEFQRFNDVLKTFEIKLKGREAAAKVKVLMCLFKWPVKAQLVTQQGHDLETGVLTHLHLNEKIKLLVRVYCVRAHNLHPADQDGSADPFIELATPSKVVSDSSNYINKQLNPTFGTCLEIAAEFPTDTLLSVRVVDHDRLSENDLIGETIVDLEDRFYSKHRGTCGIASSYSTSGYSTWRDVEKPSEILEKMCNTYNLKPPRYFKNSMLVASKEFTISKKGKTEEETKENLALQALRHWDQLPIVGFSLVPEHVETRSLYHPKRPGIEQGKLEMWVDIFDLSLGTVPPPIDIAPRKPKSYELRVVIWNTAKVPLVDDSFFVGRRHTDIFVKGWLWETKSAQRTDIHYTSVNGTGNFNWRFIFPFLYYRAEKKMVTYHKGVFDVEKTEQKVPAMLHLQVWDNDRLSKNDFIGAMEFELCNMPRGASSVRSCDINDYKTLSHTVDLFKVKHMRGWWPFIKVKKDEKVLSGGFLEAEFHLLTEDDAAGSPAGLGRSEPSALPPPLRPEFRVKFWLAPFRIMIHLLCGVHRTKVIIGLIIFALSIFLLILVYSIPMFLIKKVMGAYQVVLI